MAQRVYLLCIKHDLVDLIAAAVAATSDEAFRTAIADLRRRSDNQLRASAVSRRYAARLNRKAFENAGRIDDYYLAESLRPYVITRGSGENVRDTVRSVRYADSEAALEMIFDAEIARVGELTDDISSATEEVDDPWTGIVEEISNLREIRRAALAGLPYTRQVSKLVPFGDDMQVVLDETEPQTLEATELAKTYGFLLGATLGRVAGLCEPSWWMGRNFWLGLMIAQEFSMTERFTQRRARLMCDAMTKLASSPGRLFDAIGIAGYEEGFPLMCEGYSSGLIFGPEAVAAMLELMSTRKHHWVDLGCRASGYEETVVSQIYDVVLEAFDWAATDGCSLMEGDELVGAYGYR